MSALTVTSEGAPARRQFEVHVVNKAPQAGDFLLRVRGPEGLDVQLPTPTLHLESLWIKNVTITTGLVDTYSTPTLLAMVANGRLDTSRFVTHRFGIGEMLEAYDIFARAEDSGALKVALFRV